MNEQMLRDMMSQIIRVGFVAGRQPERMRVKVELRDTTNAKLVSDWLPVITPRACADEQYDLPDDGDQVLCLFLPYGLEQGFVLGSMYGKAEPPVQSGDKWHRKFRDGTTLEYDREAHLLSGNVKGDVKLAVSGNITVTLDGTLAETAKGPANITSAQRISLSAPAISMGGGAGGGSTTATITGDTNQRGTITVTNGDVIVEGISFLRHVHPCPHGGDTGVPK